MQADIKKSRWKSWKPLLVGFTAAALLIGLFGVWGTQAQLSGAIIATGTIEVESQRQVVQHEQGGRVAQILVRDGDTVQAGDVVVRFDDTFTRSELLIIERQFFEFQARRMRLQAERDGATSLGTNTFPEPYALQHGELESIIAGQSNLFNARLVSLALQEEQIKEQISQLENQIEGVNSELHALAAQQSILRDDKADTENLMAQGLSENRTLRGIQREEAALIGNSGRLNALVAQHRGEIAALNLQLSELRSTRRENAIAELRELEFRGGELAERRLALIERHVRLDVRAPVAGRIFGSVVTAVQSVVQAGTPMLYIVPDDTPLVVRARVNSVDVDKVIVGENAALRFSALDMRLTPEIEGVIQRVSADVITDQATGGSYYTAEIIPDETSLSQLNGQELLPGMPAEVLIRTSDRTPLNYLIKPFADYFVAALREE